MRIFADLILQELGMQDSKAVTTPTSTAEAKELATVINEDGTIHEQEYMSDDEATWYRALSARMNYLALDRTDLQQACRCICAHMSRPLRACCQMLKRAARYLKGRPRCFQSFPFERDGGNIQTFADSDWAGCPLTRKSTSGGAILWGRSLLKSWSTVQSTTAMSSGEAELYAIVKAAAQTKYVISVAHDFDIDLRGLLRTDSSAAMGITKRSGLGGRTRHVQVQYLWVQRAVQKQGA